MTTYRKSFSYLLTNSFVEYPNHICDTSFTIYKDYSKLL